MVTARHSGKLGDLIFSIPALKALGVHLIYLPDDAPEVPGFHNAVKSFMQAQGFMVGRYGEKHGYMQGGPKVDYDMDLARNQSLKGVKHIITRYLEAFKIKLDNWKEPWLKCNELRPVVQDYTIFNYTGRHIINEKWGKKSEVNWKGGWESVEGDKYFIGTWEEWKQFCEIVGEKVNRLLCIDVLDIAAMVKHAKAVYCNQSLVMSLATGFDKLRYCEFKPGKTNCRTYTKNEIVL